jgi:hypothetical protein
VLVRTSYYYARNFDLALRQINFNNHNTFAVSKGLSPGFKTRVTAFTGPVLIVTGDLDVLFYPEGAAIYPETLERTGDLFPLANFSTIIPRDVGHSLTLYLSAPEVINMVHK